MPDIEAPKDTPVPVAAVTPTPPTTPAVPVIKASTITPEGETNGLASRRARSPASAAR